MSARGAATITDEERIERLRRRGRLLEYATVGWNSVEAVVAIAAGLAAHALALTAFGLDSCVEVFGSLVVLWYMRGGGRLEIGSRSRRALRLIAVAFLVLGLYLLAEAAHTLLTRAEPQASPFGIAFMAATVLVMFGLAAGKRRTGQTLGNAPLLANARMTFLDGCLAVGILLALIATAAFGWWWVDPLAAAIVGVVALREAWEHREGSKQASDEA